MPITNREPIARRIDDDQWARISKAIMGAGCRVTDGTRLHLDGVLEMMETGRSWRDLDERFGDFRAIYRKMQEWGNGKNALFDVVTAMHALGLTKTWRKAYSEMQSGPSAMPGLPVRNFMAELNNHCVKLAEKASQQKNSKRKGAAAKRATPPKPPQADKSFSKDMVAARRRAYEQELRLVLKAKGKSKAEGLTDAQWDFICERLPELDQGPQNKSRTVVVELVRVMQSNMPWHVARTDSDSMIYHAVRKWLDEGLMPRIVRCLHDLKLTSSWSEYLISPVIEGENRLKHLIGSIVYGIVARKPTVVAKKKTVARKPKVEVAATGKAAVKGKSVAKAGKGKTQSTKKAVTKRTAAKTAAKTVNAGAKSSRTTKALSKARAAKGRPTGSVRAAKTAKVASKSSAAA